MTSYEVMQLHITESDEEEKGQKKICVKSGNSKKEVLAEEVYYIESNGRKVILHFQQQNIEYYDKIGRLEQMLKPKFFRIHKGYLVNMRYVSKYDRTEVFMKNQDKLLISKYRYQDFVKAYQEYNKREEN